ncbi:MAG: hypothetical protein CHACPFDD_01426 [Phycisphaerae bacterium]|nr:hypothetical protein [Phycisphaerae bacterium]
MLVAALPVAGCARPRVAASERWEQLDRPLVAQLARPDADGFAGIQRAFAARNAGYEIFYHPRVSSLPAADRTQIVCVQSGSALARVGAWASDVGVGDCIVLRPGQSLTLGGSIAALSFRVPADPPAEVPAFIRPDWDPRITDTPGGCATETGAYRRILLTWLGKSGPYLFHALNIHRVRIADSFTHYHPIDGGFDEFYLVQMAGPDARVITSRHVDKITQPDSVERSDLTDLLESRPLHVGDLVYLPRGVAHRGVGGALVQVITVPGFIPGAEIGLDHHLAAINRRLGLSGSAALPLNVEASQKAVVR